MRWRGFCLSSVSGSRTPSLIEQRVLYPISSEGKPSLQTRKEGEAEVVGRSWEGRDNHFSAPERFQWVANVLTMSSHLICP